MLLRVTQPNVIVLVLLQHCSFMYEQCCNTAHLHTSSVFPLKLKLNTDPEAEPYRIHHFLTKALPLLLFHVCRSIPLFNGFGPDIIVLDRKIKMYSLCLVQMGHKIIFLENVFLIVDSKRRSQNKDLRTPRISVVKHRVQNMV